MSKSSKIMKLAKAIAKASRRGEEMDLRALVEHSSEFIKLPRNYLKDVERLEFTNFKGMELPRNVDIRNPLIVGMYSPYERMMMLNPKYTRRVPGAPLGLGSTARHELTHAKQHYGVEDVDVDMRFWRGAVDAPYSLQPHEIHAKSVELSKKPFDEAYEKAADFILSELEKGNRLPEDLLRTRHRIMKMLEAGTLGVAGVGALSALGLKEAEASPAGVFEKAVVKGVEKSSSAAKRLVGQKLQGKTIKDVLKGQGNWRKLLFDDGTQMIVEKQYIHDLSRAVGTRQYISRFKEKGSEAQTVQALKSMKMHEAYAEANSQFTRQSIRDMHKRHLARVAEMGEDAIHHTAFVQRNDKFFQMPIEYAQHLEDLGVLKIVRGKEEERILKRFGVNVNRRRPELTPGGEENAVFTGRRKAESAWPRKSQGRRKEDIE